MPTFERNFSDLKKLTLADLKRLGYMVPQHRCSSTVNWTRRGETTGTIGVTVSLIGTGGFVELEYIFNSQEPMKYKVELVQLPSNLGKGRVWYFICPLTGERCRTLYQVGKYFASRKAQPRTLYESQTYSKQYRWLDKIYGPDFKADNAFQDTLKPYIKRHYRGKPTPKTRRMMKWDAICDRMNGIKPAPLEDCIYR